jgi:diguanylate cyclase (GGDEF)-like protein
VILLPQTDKNSALVVAKRLQEMMRRTQFLSDDGLNLNIRCSMGLATYPEDAKSSHEIIRQADEMMYMVKNSSRDNIAVAQQGLLR